MCLRKGFASSANSRADSPTSLMRLAEYGENWIPESCATCAASWSCLIAEHTVCIRSYRVPVNLEETAVQQWHAVSYLDPLQWDNCRCRNRCNGFVLQRETIRSTLVGVGAFEAPVSSGSWMTKWVQVGVCERSASTPPSGWTSVRLDGSAPPTCLEHQTAGIPQISYLTRSKVEREGSRQLRYSLICIYALHSAICDGYIGCRVRTIEL